MRNPGARGDGGGMKKKHVAVLLGGFSSERPVSLSSGNACADALEQEGYQVTRVDVARDVGSVLAGAEAGRGLQRAARAVRRGRHDPGHPRISRHPLHPFRRARLRARHEQGAGQEGCQGGRHSDRRIEGAQPLRHQEQASDAAALRGQAGQRRLELRRRHRQGGPVASAADHHVDANGNTATPSWSSATCMAAS